MARKVFTIQSSVVIPFYVHYHFAIIDPECVSNLISIVITNNQITLSLMFGLAFLLKYK